MKKFRIQLLLIVAVIAAGFSFSSCESDEPEDQVWYLSGTWQCLQYPDETITFFMDGTGYWQNEYSGEYEDFDYYCESNYLLFRWYPQFSPAYNEDCIIYMPNSNALEITYPPSGADGPTTLYYSRIY